jgi:hypothetical protein
LNYICPKIGHRMTLKCHIAYFPVPFLKGFGLDEFVFMFL